MKRIACLGWGSLFWDPVPLQIKDEWKKDGPSIEVELARFSTRNRITLVLTKTNEPIPSLWAEMPFDNVRDALDNLKQREWPNGPDAYFESWEQGQAFPDLITDIDVWAKSKNFDAVIWTAIPPKLEDGTEHQVPTEQDVLDYLRRLKTTGHEKEAEKYIRCAHKQITTPYRRRIEAELGWTSRPCP